MLSNFLYSTRRQFLRRLALPNSSTNWRRCSHFSELPSGMFPTSPTAIDEGQQLLEAPQLWMENCGSIKDPSLQETLSWNGWAVGSYIYIWRPAQPLDGSACDGRRWQSHPVLLIDICKPGSGEAQFVVVYLYNRRSAAQLVRPLARYARWRASISLWTWPRGHTYVLSNHFETVYEWDLRIWSRSVPPSVSTRWALDTRTNRLARYDTWLKSGVGRALSMKLNFQHFLRLPREVRDGIYDYVLLNVHRLMSQSRTCTHSLSAKRNLYRIGWPWYRDPSMPALGTPSNLSTPTILLVCSQVRREALEALYRTKTLAITVASMEDKLCNLDPKWLPSISRFLRIRFDFTTACIAAETMSECFRRVASLLLEHALSLRFLEVRIGYSHIDASAALRDHGFALLISREDVIRSMRELLPCLGMYNRLTRKPGFAERRPIQIKWGVSETQMEAGDFSCACTYLSASFLRQAWREVCGGTGEGDTDVAVQLSEQDCRHFGCICHSQQRNKIELGYPQP